VRLSRNAWSINQHALDAAGNGRSGGWIDFVSGTQLAELRHRLGERVQKPETGDKGQDPVLTRMALRGAFPAVWRPSPGRLGKGS
jgi:hypothetical protein